MKPNELTDEQKERLKSCKDSAELMFMLDGMGVELTDEQLDAVAGGRSWKQCDQLEHCIYDF